MFASIRQKLAGAWKRLREGNLAKLFLFEFAVVLLGVLAAQWVADWAERRSAIERMEEERQAFLDAFARVVPVAEGWKVATPCLDERMAGIMQAASDGRDVSSDYLRRPALYGLNIDIMDAQSFLLLRQKHGTMEGDEISRVARNIPNLDTRITALVEDWKSMALMDPANGTVDRLDRLEVRKAASAAKAHLVAININADNLLDSARILGIKPDRQSAGQPVADCAELWRTGVTHRMAQGRRPAYSRASP